MGAGIEEFRGVLRRFLAERAGDGASPAHDAGEPVDRALWGAMARELGLQGLLLPERQGGSGAGPAELALVFRELGRTLAPVPFLSSVALALPVLTREPDAAGEVAAILAGDVVAAVALWGGPAGVGVPGTDVRARVGGDGHATLTGGSAAVVDGPSADLLLVLADAPGGWTWFAVDAAAPGVSWGARPSMDLTRSWADLRLDAAPGRRVGVEGAGLATAAEALGLARLMLAAECVGVAERCLELSVDYARTRIQFGRPIGSFQAVKHRCARMLTEVSLAGAFVDESAERRDLGLGASAALARAAAAAYRVAADTIQVHGGIGVTWEHPAHRYFKRAVCSRRVLGSTDALRRELAVELAL